MEWKKFGIKGKLVSAKQKLLNTFKLLASLGNEDFSVSLQTPVSTVAPYELVKFLTDYSLEAELKKAEALEYWRRRLNRPM